MKIEIQILSGQKSSHVYKQLQNKFVVNIKQRENNDQTRSPNVHGSVIKAIVSISQVCIGEQSSTWDVTESDSESLQKDLDSLANWSQKWMLKFNSSI